MNKVVLFGFSAHRRGPVSRMACTARLASIRFATVFGGLCAFALLCVISIRSNAAPLADSVSLVDNSRPAPAMIAHDAREQQPMRQACNLQDAEGESARRCHTT
ncbi:hypothetical protein [Paraburkholderia haematera]|uniref:hypothetical protein n=1 Tax=Paraburkholderia haematera TaxID=2793077 RepID=UPI001B8AE323|nr:hypothetical protein [Paraburkholderia haematera]